MFDIIRTIGSITRKLQIQSNHNFQRMNLGNNRFIYIIRVCENPGMFIGEVADQLSIDRTTAFRTIKNLERIGYVTFIDDETDKRLRRVYPTQMSYKIYPELHSFELFSSEELLKNLNVSERQQLLILLKKLMP